MDQISQRLDHHTKPGQQGNVNLSLSIFNETDIDFPITIQPPDYKLLFGWDFTLLRKLVKAIRSLSAATRLERSLKLEREIEEWRAKKAAKKARGIGQKYREYKRTLDDVDVEVDNLDLQEKQEKGID